MTLRLIDRIATLLRADAHGVVEALEERALLLKQSVRDAELALLEKQARVAALAEEEARALDEDVVLALAGEREDLARFAIRRLLPLRRELAALEREGAALAASRGALADEVATQQEQLEDLRGRVRTRLAESRGAGEADPAFGSPPVDDAEVELELLRRRGAAGGEHAR
jgi:phage shock protein A